MSIGKFKDVVASRGFQPFLWTQFLGALNDNLYKMIVSLAATVLVVSDDDADRTVMELQNLGEAAVHIGRIEHSDNTAPRVVIRNP